MASEALTGRIGDTVSPVLAGLGYDVEEVAVLTPPGRRDIRIVVDRDGGATLDDLADVSRAVEAALDAADVMGEAPYDLELTTPGIGRPLTEPRHWRRAQGRKVALEYVLDGSDRSLVARVGQLEDAAVTLVTADKGRIGTLSVPLDSVRSAAVDVDFTRPGEAELRACGLDDAEIARRREPA